MKSDQMGAALLDADSFKWITADNTYNVGCTCKNSGLVTEELHIHITPSTGLKIYGPFRE